jgi:hypothetical protein
VHVSQNPLQDLAHHRFQCGKYAFDEGGCSSNVLSCSQVCGPATMKQAPADVPGNWPPMAPKNCTIVLLFTSVEHSMLMQFAWCTQLLLLLLQCYCYICDTKAEECKLWGDGE